MALYVQALYLDSECKCIECGKTVESGLLVEMYTERADIGEAPIAGYPHCMKCSGWRFEARRVSGVSPEMSELADFWQKRGVSIEGIKDFPVLCPVCKGRAKGCIACAGQGEFIGDDIPF